MQDVLWTLLELAANTCEAFLCIHFVIRSFNGKCRIFKSTSVHIIGTVGLTAVVTTLNQITAYEGVLGLFYAAFLITFSAIFLSGTFLKKFFISVLTLICLISTAAVSGNILSSVFKNAPMDIYTEHSFERFIFMVVGTLFLAYVLAILSRFTRGKKESLSIKEWVLIFSVLVISFIIVAVIQSIMLENEISSKNLSWLMMTELGIVMINILCLYITVSLNETHKREEQLLLDKKRSEYNRQYAETIKEQYEQARRLRHDMKQYAGTMQALIKDKKFSEAESLAEQQSDNLSKVETIINVENDILNAILNSKLSFAKSKGINVFCSIEKDISGIEDIDLCNLLGNLLDNAITAAEKCDTQSRLIEIIISSAGSKLVITVKNSIQSSVISENSKLKSTKENSDEHGFGVKTIKYIAEKYDGKADFYEENLTFICRVELRKETSLK